MANYPLVSGKEILARVIRALGYKLPSTYHDDVLEWIPEGLGMLQVTNSVILCETADINCPGELLVKNHCVGLPCGLIQVAGVYDEFGKKIYPGNQVTNDQVALSQMEDSRSTIFNVNPFAHQTQTGIPTDEVGTSIPWDGSDLTDEVSTVGVNKFYIIKGNNIQTSMSEGYIKLRYYSVPVCSQGYPLIPNEENFKSAVEWHVIRRLLGAGLAHPIFSYDMANAEFEKYAARGVAAISFPTPDKMAATSRMLVRLIPPDSYVEDYFINP